MKPTLTVVMPALNEEANISAAVSEVIQVVRPRCADYEVILINDGSTDRTGQIMEEFARGNPSVRVLHNTAPENTGAALSAGVKLARCEYIMMVPGDNENPSSALIGPIEAIGSADIVIPYTVNQQVRPMSRRVLSWIYVRMLNLLFGLRLRYYNGTAIYKTEHLRQITVRTTSFAHLAERLIKLVRGGRSYVEIGVAIATPSGRCSKALRLKNFAGVSRSIAGLLYEVYVLRSIPVEGE